MQSCFCPKLCDFNAVSPSYMSASCPRRYKDRYPFSVQMLQVQPPISWRVRERDRVLVCWIAPRWQMARKAGWRSVSGVVVVWGLLDTEGLGGMVVLMYPSRLSGGEGVVRLSWGCFG